MGLVGVVFWSAYKHSPFVNIWAIFEQYFGTDHVVFVAGLVVGPACDLASVRISAGVGACRRWLAPTVQFRQEPVRRETPISPLASVSRRHRTRTCLWYSARRRTRSQLPTQLEYISVKIISTRLQILVAGILQIFSLALLKHRSCF